MQDDTATKGGRNHHASGREKSLRQDKVELDKEIRKVD